MNRFKQVFSGASAALMTLSCLLTIGFTGVADATSTPIAKQSVHSQN